MHLWTDYEGRTIAGAYTLGKLLRSEGRNGFFATSDSTGNSAIIRLTESHFDEEEVLKRWRHVAELHQGNLIEIERVGQTNFDGVALTYALMEHNDANLDDVLRERPLTTAETMEVGKSVVAALSALHAGGLVHEHIEPANVLAVGEVVKLRSDCVRECVADGEFTSAEACEDLRKRDVHDFGMLLLRCLTLEKEWTGQRLADPFQRLIPGALEGTMSLAQMSTALNPPVFTPQSPAAATQPSYAPAATQPSYAPTAQPTYTSRTQPAQGQQPAAAGNNAVASSGAESNGAGRNGAGSSGAGNSGAAARPLVPREAMAAPAAAVASVSAAAQTASPAAETRAAGYAEPSIRMRAQQREDVVEETPGPSKLVWIAGAVAALVVLLLIWHFVSAKPAAMATAPAATSQAAPVVAPAARATAASRKVEPAPTATQPAESAARAAAPVASAHGRPGWYVIAYTYNREDQAHGKAVRLSTHHLSMHAEVFSPNGHAPYLVSLGGPMSEDEAESVLHRARRSGLPRDTFIRHY
ncbi:MAG: hypothetical protein ACRYFU_04795 [Janthinobacterium lividum]